MKSSSKGRNNINKDSDKKFTIPGKYLLVLVMVLCTALMILSFNSGRILGPLDSAVNYLLIPFQEGVSSAGTWLSDKTQTMQDIEVLRKENESLREQVAQLTEEKTNLQQGSYELAQLQALYQIDQEYQDYEKIGARIIAKDSGNWYHSFLINKGSNDGLKVDMNVMAAGGLVGRIASVGPDWARVETIIDDNSNTSASVLATSDNIIVSGDLKKYESGTIGFSQLSDPDNQVNVGDKVVTSNISDKYLPGILIGYISEINNDSNSISKSGSLTPAVDFKHLDTVLIITELKQTVDESEE